MFISYTIFGPAGFIFYLCVLLYCYWEEFMTFLGGYEPTDWENHG